MRVAAVQRAPAYLDRDGSLGIVIECLEQAAADGVEVVVFPESFVPGYPSWTDFTHASWLDHPTQKQAFAQYLAAAVQRRQGPGCLPRGRAMPGVGEGGVLGPDLPATLGQHQAIHRKAGPTSGQLSGDGALAHT